MYNFYSKLKLKLFPYFGQNVHFYFFKTLKLLNLSLSVPPAGHHNKN